MIENAFGILKQRFRQLQMLEFHTVDKLTKFVMAVCVLHNICIMKNDTEAIFDSNWNIGDDNDASGHPEDDIPENIPRSDLVGTAMKLLGEQKRREITNNLPCCLRARN